MTDVLVLGAGMVGTATALALQARGVDAVLIDRRAPGRETSFGNAGVIQAEAVEPYAFPRALRDLWRIATGRSGEVAWRLSGLPSQGSALARYWRASAPARHRAISESYAPLIRRATAAHAPLIEAAGAGNLVRRDGFLEVYLRAAALDAAAGHAREVKDRHGVGSDVLTGEEMRRAEPALAVAPAGAIRWRDSWTCLDPGALVAAYAGLFARRGGRIATGDAGTLRPDGAGWSVRTEEGPLSAAQAVVALGPWSPEVLRPLGLRIPMIRKRGYHRHYGGEDVLRTTMVIAEGGFVLAPMRAGLRLTTGAEISRPDAPPRPVQLLRAERVAARLLGGLPPARGDIWHGTRPCLPDMLPLVGPAPGHAGLWLQFGHGHQGFTLGPATADLIADEMAGTGAPVPDALRPEGRV